MEDAKRKVIRHEEATKFIRKCLLHNLNPKFVRFKLYRDSASRSKAAVNFRRNLQSELQVDSKCLRNLEEGVVRRKEKLFQSLGPITVVCVRRFLATKEQQERSRVQERHLHKLRLLGLHDNKRVEGTLHNFSSKPLTQAETEILARGLDYCIYPHRLNLLKIKVEFKETHGTKTYPGF